MTGQRITYRLMTAADVQVTAYIRKNALVWLASTEGRSRDTWMPMLAPHFAHIIRTDPEGSFVAEINGLVVGYAQGFVRGDIWFLAQLFVQPDVHAHGIGRELLRRALDYARAKGARIFSVVSSTSPAAQSLYMRSGMYGVGIGYRMAGPVEPLLALPGPDGNQKTIVDCSGWLDRIDDLDRGVFGAARRQDHELYLRGDRIFAGASFGLTRDGEFAGYAYADESGWVGPLAAPTPEGQLPLLRLCAAWLRDREVGDGRTYVLSLNPTLMHALLAAGWRIGGWTFLLASGPFGKFDRYHPSGGLLL